MYIYIHYIYIIYIYLLYIQYIYTYYIDIYIYIHNINISICMHVSLQEDHLGVHRHWGGAVQPRLQVESWVPRNVAMGKSWKIIHVIHFQKQCYPLMIFYCHVWWGCTENMTSDKLHCFLASKEIDLNHWEIKQADHESAGGLRQYMGVSVKKCGIHHDSEWSTLIFWQFSWGKLYDQTFSGTPCFYGQSESSSRYHTVSHVGAYPTQNLQTLVALAGFRPLAHGLVQDADEPWHGSEEKQGGSRGQGSDNPTSRSITAGNCHILSKLQPLSPATVHTQCWYCITSSICDVQHEPWRSTLVHCTWQEYLDSETKRLESPGSFGSFPAPLCEH